jgi:lysophospholipase L1-like esterase
MAIRQGQADRPPVELLSRRRPLPAAAVPAAALLAAILLAGCLNDDPPSNGPGYSPANEADSGSRTARQDPAPADTAPLLADGDRVVLIGDSLATEAPPTYADLLPAAASRHGAKGVETVNLAEPGTTSADWLPGSPLFEQQLAPELDGADLVLITVGGNDLQAGVGATDGVEALSTGASSADAAFDAIEASGRNMRKTFAAIRRINPKTSIAYVAYPDYSAATAWQQNGSAAALALGVGLSSLLDAAQSAGPDAVVDMLAETDAHQGGVDPLLADDPEYLGPEGHRFYAERIAALLAG